MRHDPIAPAPRHRSRPAEAPHELLLRELTHRCANDLQLVVSMLELQARSTASDEARRELMEATNRVMILAHCRSALQRQETQNLDTALRQVCEALQSQAELMGVLIRLRTQAIAAPLSESQITVLALAVNELMTNALKHAFAERATGTVTVSVADGGGQVVVTVDDDGLPFPPTADTGLRRPGGLGLGLVGRLLASVGAMIIPPRAGSKLFEIRLTA